MGRGGHWVEEPKAKGGLLEIFNCTLETKNRTYAKHRASSSLLFTHTHTHTHTQGRGPGGAGRWARGGHWVEEPKAKGGLPEIFNCTLETKNRTYAKHRASSSLLFTHTHTHTPM